MQNINVPFSSMPFYIQGIPIVVGLITLSLVFIFVARRYAIYSSSKTELVSLYSNGTGVLYSVLLALITVNAWDDFNQVDSYIESEAYTLGDVYRETLGYPQPVGEVLRKGLRSYVNTILDEEWKMLRSGSGSTAARPAINKVQKDLIGYEPKTQTQYIMHEQLIANLNSALHFHRQIVSSTDESVMPLLWAVVWIGAIINLFINALSTSGSLTIDCILGGSFSLTIGLVILLVYGLDHPFLGDFHVSEAPYIQLMQFMDSIDASLKEP